MSFTKPEEKKWIFLKICFNCQLAMYNLICGPCLARGCHHHCIGVRLGAGRARVTGRRRAGPAPPRSKLWSWELLKPWTGPAAGTDQHSSGPLTWSAASRPTENRVEDSREWALTVNWGSRVVSVTIGQSLLVTAPVNTHRTAGDRQTHSRG